MTSSSHDIPGFGFSPRLLLGLGLALFGVVLMLDRLGMVDASSVLRFWPLILIAIGLQQFFNPRERGPGRHIVPVNGIIWMALGGILLLNSFGILRVSIWELFWPVLLIALGVRLITRPGLRGRDFRDTPGPGSTTAASGDVGTVFAVLGGVKRVSAPQPFYGADVTTFMGGAHLDLRQAILAPGAEAVLDVFAVMGGCEVLIPPGWVVSAPVVAIMGGVDDKRIVSTPTMIEQATASGGPAPRLVIRGFVMMGGVTIRS
jgi:predicted membrane protein